jgi:hypothetical protein
MAVKSVRFRFERALPVPVGYTFAWYTDLRAEDAEIGGNLRKRTVLARGADFVDIEEEAELLGQRVVGRLRLTRSPPDRWRVEGSAKHGTVATRYHLTAVPGGCRLTIESEWRFTTWVRFFVPFFRGRLTRELTTDVDLFRAALEKDFAAGQPAISPL